MTEKVDIIIGPVSNRADFSEAFQWFEDGEPIPLTDSTLEFIVRDKKSHSVKLSASTDDGKVTFDDDNTICIIAFDETEMHGICAGEYNVGLRITVAGEKSQLFVGILSVYEGWLS